MRLRVKPGTRAAKIVFSSLKQILKSLPTRNHWDRENLACRVEDVACSRAGITGCYSADSPLSSLNRAGKQRVSSINRLF